MRIPCILILVFGFHVLYSQPPEEELLETKPATPQPQTPRATKEKFSYLRAGIGACPQITFISNSDDAMDDWDPGGSVAPIFMLTFEPIKHIALRGELLYSHYKMKLSQPDWFFLEDYDIFYNYTLNTSLKYLQTSLLLFLQTGALSGARLALFGGIQPSFLVSYSDEMEYVLADTNGFSISGSLRMKGGEFKVYFEDSIYRARLIREPYKNTVMGLLFGSEVAILLGKTAELCLQLRIAVSTDDAENKQVSLSFPNHPSEPLWGSLGKGLSFLGYGLQGNRSPTTLISLGLLAGVNFTIGKW
ncbi:MAG: outer membrane beta-barrel protein [Bacteroidia bacterium]|nr:PorT family protein [Bacteroidia bacterium]MDW8133722.1 outer membrane beta-barrel protein [Bacteroidia bacterium]